MSNPTPIYIQLDRKREVRWTKRAEVRMAELRRPVFFNDLAKNPKRLPYVLAALLWASLVDRDHPFEDPADLGEHLTTDEQQSAAVKAAFALYHDAYPEKKSGAESVTGQGQSSAESVPAPSGGS